MDAKTLPFALCAYSLPHVMGYLPTRDGDPNPNPLDAAGFIEAACELKLAGVEFPLLPVVPSFDGAEVQVRASKQDITVLMREKGLQFIADYGALLDHDVEHIKTYLRQAADAGATVVRATLSHILCGDRRNFKGGWQAHRNALAARLKEVLPFAEELGLALAVENHQDATSADLLWLHENSGNSSAFGITLDTGNPLAVGEDCVEFAAAIAPLIRHVHAKDYTIHFAPNGYRLVRCAAGEGVVDFPKILNIARQNGHPILPAIEIAAQATRTVPMLEQSWWEHYPARRAESLLPVLRVLWEKGRPQNEAYSSAWERSADSETVAKEEWEVVRRSAAYFRQIEGQ